MPIHNVLDLSVKHVIEEPDWGNVKYAETPYGWVVFVEKGLDKIVGLPSWLVLPWLDAVAKNCILINFDRNARTDKSLLTYRK